MYSLWEEAYYRASRVKRGINMKDGNFFVVSNSDYPEHIYFKKEEALDSGYRYIDVFDEEGELVEAYEYNHDACEYVEIVA